MRYEIVKSRHWKHSSGKTASIHGAAPYYTEEEKQEWEIVDSGWTIYDYHFNTYGMGRKPFATREEAEQLVSKWNSQ